MRMPVIRDRIVCADGASISAQAGSAMYCTPRNNRGPWTHVECGFPTGPLPERFVEFQEELTDDEGHVYASGVYPYLPLELVQEFIDMHGGPRETGFSLRKEFGWEDDGDA